MKNLIETSPAIIKEAAQSELGILALMVIALGAVGYIFFRKAREKARLAVFTALFVGVAAFAAAVVRVRSNTPPATASTPTVTSPAAGASPSAATVVEQKTGGDNSPAVSGVGGDVNFSVGTSNTSQATQSSANASTAQTLPAQKVTQETKGANSPAIQGVDGSVSVTVDDKKKP
jgi:hypothetical protein